MGMNITYSYRRQKFKNCDTSEVVQTFRFYELLKSLVS